MLYLVLVFYGLPAGLPDARDHAFIGHLAKTDAADHELPIDGSGAAADLTTGIGAAAKLRFFTGFIFKCLG